MVLALSPQQLSAISNHAEQVYPEECCGLMVGTLTAQANRGGKEALKSLVELVPLANEWTPTVVTEDGFRDQSANSKRRRYYIDPKDMLRVQKQAREKGLKIIGIYHSHPDQVAEPSECDRAQAWPEYAYTIVSVQGQSQALAPGSNQGKENAAKTVDVKTWALDSDHQFQLEPMNVSHSCIPAFATDRMPVSAQTSL